MITDVLFTTNRIDNISPVILALSAWNLERPFAKFTEIDPVQVAKRPGVPDEAPPEIKVDLDFANGMGPLEINAPSKLKKALKYEIVDDPTSPAKGKVLKITVPPGDYQGNQGDEGYARISLEMPYRVKKSVRSLVVDLKVETTGTGYHFGNLYLRAADMSVKGAGFQMYALGKDTNNQWERKFFAVNQRGNMEQRMKKASQARFYRLCFFLDKQIDAPIEIRVGNIGTSVDCIAPAPMWKEGGEAEPL